jgi:hydrophobe/amphiphile efflux-1 (HAE1) family protein
MILRPTQTSRGILGRFFGGFNRVFDWTTNRYLAASGAMIRRWGLSFVALCAVYFLAGGLFSAAPGGFLPDEDQGVVFVQVRLPDGASLERNEKVSTDIENYLLSIPGVEDVVTFGGLDMTTQTSSSNVSTLIAVLTPWADRRTPETQIGSIIGRVNMELSRTPEAFIIAFGLPPILGLGTSGGFEFMVEDRTGGDAGELAAVAQKLAMDASKEQPSLAYVANTFRVSVPGYRVNLDEQKAQTLGIPITDVYDSLQTFLGGLYINDFNRFGRTWRVIMQADPDYRRQPDDVNRFYVRNSGAEMVPLSTLVDLKPTSSPDVIYRYNRYRAAKLMGGTSPGFTAGQSANAMEEMARKNLPPGYAYEWTGTVFQQRMTEGNEAIIFGFAAVMVFLFLAAQYESWMLPLAVIASVPLGIFGAMSGILARGFAYDVYTQIGIVTLIGLASKNAILIVEFAKLRREAGKPIIEAALESARLRLRPILMTSFAFILGVAPLLMATGAGGAARRALGTAVFSGMTAATVLAVFFVPALYVIAQRLSERRPRPVPQLSEVES